MPYKKLNIDLNHCEDGAVQTAAMQSSTSKKSGFFSFENPGFVLILYNFIFALPLSYFLTHLNKQIISFVGYEKIMRCPSGILFSRFLFVAVNMWLVVGWGRQLEGEAWERKCVRVEELKEMVGWWEEEVRRLEAVMDVIEEAVQRDVEEQILRESPMSAHNKHASTSAIHLGNSDGKVKSDSSANRQYRATAKEADEHGYEVEDFEDDEESDEGGGDDERDGEWNGSD